MNLFFILLLFITLLSLKYLDFSTIIKYYFLSISLIIVLYFIDNYYYYVNFIYIDNWKIFFILIVIVCFLIILQMLGSVNIDVLFLNLLIIVGSIIVILSDNFILLYLGLELQTFSLFILISRNRNSIKSSEAGLKYFILGALSSGIYLLGLYFLFLLNTSIQIKDFNFFCNNYIYFLGVLLIIFAFIFKLALFPLHFWLPDIYEGSYWDVIGLLSTIPKISVLSVLLQFGFNSNLLLICSLLSIIVGTLGALNQTKLKRLLAYSGISHMGFMVLGYNILSVKGYESSSFYMLIYMLTSLFLILIIINHIWKGEYYLIELGGLQFINKFLSFSLIIIFLSIAGIPPLSGFINKWFVIWNILDSNYIISSFILILFSIIGAGYYLRLVKIVYFQKGYTYLTWYRILKYPVFNKHYQLMLIGIGIYITVFIILNPSPILIIINYTFSYIF